MSAKHTPGPWELDTNNYHAGHIATVYGTGDGEYTEVWSRRWMDRPNSDANEYETRKADAALIAAAPELLAAIKEAVEQFGPFLDDGSIVISAEQVCAMRAAIAKAEGHQ